MENTEHSKIARVPGFCVPSHQYSFLSSAAHPRAMQAAESEGCSQANSWLIEIILKVGWDWTKQSKSLSKPTQICLYLYKIVNRVLKDFRLLLYWLLLQIFLLSVLKSCWLPVLIKCCLCCSAAQAHSAAWMERPRELSTSCLEPAPQGALGMAAWPWAQQCPLRCRRQEKEEKWEMLSCCQNTARARTLQSLYTFVHPGTSSSREMRLKWEWGRRESCPVLLGQRSWDVISCPGRAQGSGCSWGRKVSKLPPSPSARAVASPKLSLH